MISSYRFIFILFSLIFFVKSNAQEFRIFTLSDFDLKDSVKTCLVSTNYGKEEYDFNKNGLLAKSVTRYNESDYDVTYYKYSNNELIEKRSETYRENKFDPSTSIANFYEIDSIPNRKITEKIVSYEKEFLDQYVYEFNKENSLVKMTRTNSDGTDVTMVEHKRIKGEYTITYLLNNVPLKSIRKSTQTGKSGAVQKVVLTKEYLKGEENMAFEEVFGPKENYSHSKNLNTTKRERVLFLPKGPLLNTMRTEC